MISLYLLALLLQQGPTIAENSRVDYVVLDVVARDADNKPVTDLTSADFQILDGRKKVQLSHFETLDFGDLAASSVHQDAAIEADDLDPIEQTLILVLDFGALGQTFIHRTIEQLEDLFTNLKNDRSLQILLYSMDIGMISSGFTSNPMEVIDDLVTFDARMSGVLDKMDGRMAGPSLLSLERQLGQCFPQSQGSSELLGGTNSGGTRMIGPCIENAFRFFVQAQEVRSRKVITSLEKFIGVLAGVPRLEESLFGFGWLFS